MHSISISRPIMDSKPMMSEGFSCLVLDDESEDALLRNVEEFNAKFEDARQWSETKCKNMLNDEEMQRYIDLVPGTNLGTRRRKVIALVKANPCLRSINPDVLYQRVSFFLWKYGEKSQKVHRKRKTPMLKTIVKLQTQANTTE